MQNQQYYSSGGGSNGFHQQSGGRAHAAPPPAVTPPPELAQMAEEFCTRYPVDANAMDYLLTSSPEVQARVVQEFRPPREGEGDYSALLTAFVKRCRGDARAAGGAALAAGAPALAPSGGTIVGAGGQLLQLGPTGIYEPVEVHESMGWAGQQESLQLGPPPLSIDGFLARYPVDERACDYFSCQRPEVQDKVLREFRPPREGEADYSSLFMSFVKRCRADARFGGPAPVAPSSAPRPLVFATPTPLLQQNSRGVGGVFASALASNQAQQQAAAQAANQVAGGIEALGARYPIDDRARDYFSTCPADVQDRVLREFRPPREGEADYSSLFMAFVKRCRQGARQEIYHPPFAPSSQMHHAHSGAVLSPGPEGLETFRQRYPVDERAMAYLAESSEEVRERVLNTFVPPRPDDTDFSAPVTAYVRECRRLLDPGVQGGASLLQQAGPTQRPEEGYTGASSGYGATGGHAGVLDMSGGQDTSGDELNSFMQRYPIDARAFDYLSTSSPGVISRVVHEFSPKQEGDSDYSALVMAFTKRVRGEERAGAAGLGGGYVEPPWKRPRAF